MKAHLNDGQLRAALDNELASDELQHLETCAQCQSRQKVLQTEIQSTAERLHFLSSPTQAKGLSTSAAWKKLRL